VALERQNIEKKDFPIGRKGYDPDAVDQHLSAIADEVEELKQSSRRRADALAAAASEQVRTIVGAAEGSAAEIQRQAEEAAREIRDEAASEAHSTREQASTQSREFVTRVSEATAVMLQRLEAMESELSAVIESLRTSATRLSADLQLLEGNLSEVKDAVAPRPRFEPEPDAGDMVPEAPAVVEAEVEKEAVVAEVEGGMGEGAPEGAGDGSDDSEGARLIALNMALNGTPREETDRYLAENFQLADRSTLLDEVYASVEG
jgi:hypothetical protein